MSELRKDPVVGRWVIISSERGRRPTDFVREPVRPKLTSCVFCPGPEDKTPPEILAGRPPASPANTPGWSYRVVPNKFPALRIEGELEASAEGLFDRMEGIGAHEVVIETPDHQASLATLPVEVVADVLLAYRERVLDLAKDRRFEYVLVFKNHGEAAGASLEHPHSQLIATPIIPIMVSEELAGSAQYYDLKERCVWCDMVRQERRGRGRLVLESPEFVALAPFAPRFPFETWVLPRRHRAFFEDAPREEFEGLSHIIKTVLQRMNKALLRPPYNLVIHSSPFYEQTGAYYHWHVEIMPVLTKVAGFERGTGFYVNPVAPEEAAKVLRETRI